MKNGKEVLILWSWYWALSRYELCCSYVIKADWAAATGCSGIYPVICIFCSPEPERYSNLCPALFCSVAMVIVVLAVCFLYFREQNKVLSVDGGEADRCGGRDAGK